MSKEPQFRISIGGVEVGDGLPPHLIAEIGLNHNGSVALAHRMIDAAAASGATMVKFQRRTPSALATAAFLDAPFDKCPLFGKTQRAVRERLELDLGAWRELKAHAEGLGLVFFSSIFDLESLKLVEQIGLPAIKVASHSLTNGPLLQAIAGLGLPVMASVGGSSWEERDRAVEILSAAPLLLFHCVSAYPTPDTMIRLDTIPALRARYRVPVGFSSHEEGTVFSAASVALGASILERHFTLNRGMVGLDHGISLEPAEFARLAIDARRIAKGRGVVAEIDPSENAARLNYHVAVCARRNLAAGTVLTEADLVCKQPLRDPAQFFTGLEVAKVIGHKLAADVAADTAIPRALVL